MSQFYLLGYFVLCVIVITLINSYVLKKKKASVASDNGKATTTEKDIAVKAVISEPSADPNQKPMKIGKILFVLLFGMFIAILNQTVINVLLPLIMGDLNTSTTTAQWLITGFMLVNGMLIPISAFLIERYGFRKLFITAMISFTIGSLICALATSFPVMMFGRVVQAIGAGILMPLGMNVFMTAFPPEKRGTAMGTMGIAMILAPAIGPTLSGWIVESYHWNVMFYGMFFLGIINLLFAAAWFHPKKELSNPAFDFFGILFSSVGFGGLLYGFSEAGSKHWSSPEVVIGLSLGVIFLFLFVWRQLTVEKPLLELRVLKYDIYTLTIIINSIVTMALFGAMLLLPIYLQNIRGFTPLQSGLLLLPGALIMGLMGPIAGKLFDKYGIRVLAIVGLVITSYATYEFTKLTGETPYSHILGIYILRSFGMSLIMMPIMTAGMNQLPQHLISHGTALSNTIRQVAGSIGTAILVTIMTQQTTEHLSNYTNTLTTNNDFFSSQLSQLGNSGIMSLYAKAIKTSTIDGINDAFLFATLLGLVALLLSFFLRTPKINREE